MAWWYADVYSLMSAMAERCMSMQLQQWAAVRSAEQTFRWTGQPWKNESYALKMYPMSYNLRVPSKCWKQQGFLTMELELVHPISFVVLVMSFQFVNSTPVCDLPIFIGMRLIVLQGCCTWNNKHPLNSVYEHWWGCSEPVSNGLI